MQALILAVDDSEVSLRMLRATLSQAGHQVTTVSSGRQALDQVNDLHPNLVILDVMMPEMDGYQVCQKLRDNPTTAHLPIMMLTAQDTLAEKVKAFQVGADDYMVKPYQPAELQARVQSLLRRASPQEPVPQESIAGKTIAVFSLRGGVGVSTIAANLAVGLTQLWASPAFLVDLALTAGHVAIMLNLVPRTTWGELIPIRLEDIDRDVLNQVVLIHPSGTHVLSAPRRADQRELLTSEKISKVLGLLKKSYSYVVLDLPHSTDELTLEALDQADEILLVLAPELASVVSASSALEIFDNLGYPKNKIRLVLNYITERQDLGLAIVEEAVKRPINVIVPCAPDIVVAAINKGAPFVVDKFNTPIGSILEDLAFLMSKDEDRNKRPYKPSPMWERATHRFQQRKKK